MDFGLTMYTYTFDIPIQYSSNDPVTPMSGSTTLRIQFQAASFDDAKAAITSALANATSAAEAVSLPDLYIAGP
jgi:hypothetical protein